MNKLFLLLVFSTFSVTGFSQSKDYKIKIKIEGMQDSTCYLIDYYGKWQRYRDTATFNNKGVVVFSGKEQHHSGIYGVYTGGKQLFEFIINNESVIDLETDTKDFINNMKVNKSKENELFFKQMKFVMEQQKVSMAYNDKLKSKEISDKQRNEINEKLVAIGKGIKDYRLNIINKYPNMFAAVIIRTMKEPEAPNFSEVKNDSLKGLLKYEYYRNHFFDEVDFSDERINSTPLYNMKLDKYFNKIVYPLPDSIIKKVDLVINKTKGNDELFKYTVHKLLSHYERSKIMGMDAVFTHIALNYYTQDLAFWADSIEIEKIQDKALKLEPLLIGKTAINLSLSDTSGNIWASMYELKADYTLLVFWAPNCGHCKKELPKLAHYIDSIKPSIDIEVYSVSSSHNEEWKKFIRENKLDFVNVAVPQEVYKDQKKATEYILKGYTDLNSLNYSTTYDVFTTPQIYLLDKSKKIIAKKLDTRLLKTYLEKREQGSY